MSRRDFLKSALTVAALAPVVKLNSQTGGDRRRSKTRDRPRCVAAVKEKIKR